MWESDAEARAFLIVASAKARPALLVIFWVLAAAATPLWGSLNVPGWGWDFHVYSDAVQSLREGHDPYVQGTMAQQDFYSHRAFRGQDFLPRPGHPPLPYLYSPLTLPVLRAIGSASHRSQDLLGWLYWLAYLAGVLGVLWTVMQFVEEEERRVFFFLAPAAVFFPGLLQHDVLLGGNVAFILYGVIYVALARSWRSGRWFWFYLTVLFASCLKVPFLCLLAIPVLSAPRQWVAASFTAFAGLALFAIQPILWPAYFQSYLQAASLNPEYLGFGLSPAGLLGQWLRDGGRAYAQASTLFYLLYAVPLFASLLFLSRGFMQGRLALTRWGPVMLIGVTLLNPRLKEYDVAPLTLPMALVAWRICGRVKNIKLQAFLFGLLLLSANLIAALGLFGEGLWNVTMCVLLVGLCSAGSQMLKLESGFSMGIRKTIES